MDKAHDYIESVFCAIGRLPAGFQSVNDCDRAALRAMNSYLKANPIQTAGGRYTRSRRSSNRSRRSYSSPAPTPATEPPIAGFCDRTAGVQTSVLAELSGVTCSTVTQTHLDTITRLTLSYPLSVRPTGSGDCNGKTAALKSGDFANLRELIRIDFDSNCLRSLPEDIFSGLAKLEEIVIGLSPLESFAFPANIFRDLRALRKIHLPEDQCKECMGPGFQTLDSSVEIVEEEWCRDITPSNRDSYC